VQGARDGELIPTAWREGGPDAHEFFEQDWLDALDRFDALKTLSLVAGFNEFERNV
jgi:hypothetical protein